VGRKVGGYTWRERGMLEEFNEIETVLAEALGYKHSKNFGWVVGDQTPLSLADEIARKYKGKIKEADNLKRDNKRLTDAIIDLHYRMEGLE
jgi:hypothetical protein